MTDSLFTDAELDPQIAAQEARQATNQRRINTWATNFTTPHTCPACGHDAGAWFRLRINHGLAPNFMPGAADFSRLRKCTAMGWRPSDITEADRAAARALEAL